MTRQAHAALRERTLTRLEGGSTNGNLSRTDRQDKDQHYTRPHEVKTPHPHLSITRAQLTGHLNAKGPARDASKQMLRCGLRLILPNSA
mmetsp:Transcript_17342/g.29661  ORF Transcript_17342/g.29661 Transcript_17342/m.29661 type:complete len:89 (+) Transcript_17342:374-640(+)